MTASQINWRGACLGALGVTTSPAWLIVAVLAPALAALVLLVPQGVGMIRAALSGVGAHAIAFAGGVVAGPAASALGDSITLIAAGAVVLAVVLTLLLGGHGPARTVMIGGAVLVAVAVVLLSVLVGVRDWVFLVTFYAAWTVLPALARPVRPAATVADA